MLTRTHTALLALLVLVVLATLLLRPTPRTAPLVLYASPTGTGTACSETAPCRVADAWPRMQPGATLLLRDGTYKRSQGGAIDPPDTLAGTADKPITVKALNDGQVTIDAEHTGFAVFLQTGNDWWRVEGVNGTNGTEAIFRSRANHVRFVRVIAYEGTSGEADSLGISMSGPGIDQVCIDCAAWGTNMRKLFEFSQSQAPNQDMQGSGCRRCWGEWNDHPEGVSKPNNVYQGGYRSRGQIWENVIGTWRETGTVGDAEGIFRMFYGCQETDMRANLTLLGSLFYLSNGAGARLGQLATADCGSQMTFRDVVALVGSDHTTVKPFLFRSSSGSLTPEQDNVCERCVGVSSTPSVNQEGSGWTMPGFREGRSLAEAMGGANVYTALPGLCYQVEAGVLTNKPNWPWPMEHRIRQARIASGAPEVSVTGVVESLLGVIPDHCRSDRQPVPPQPPQPGAMTCTGTVPSVPGAVTLTCQPQEGTR
jgi:hypothetical protein